MEYLIYCQQFNSFHSQAPNTNRDTSDLPLSIALLFIPVPSYPLARGLMYFSLNRVAEEFLASLTGGTVSDPLTNIRKYIGSLVGQTCLYLMLLVIIQLIMTHSSRYDTSLVLVLKNACIYQCKFPLDGNEDELHCLVIKALYN